MSRIATVRYTGNLHSDLTHLQSGNVISTDAPTDNNGRGEAFSPTDLLAASLGACAMTIMGMKAADLGADLVGARAPRWSRKWPPTRAAWRKWRWIFI